MSIRKLLSGFSYSVFSNLVTLFVSVVLLLLVPKQISISEYGYWQLYIFYISYIAYAAFGLSEGVYLKYGGFLYNKLPKQLLRFQFWFLYLFLVLFFISIYLLFRVISGHEHPNIDLVFLFACLVGLVIVPKGYLVLILQTTNNIKLSVLTNIIEKLLYFLGVVALLALGFASLETIIVVDLTAKVTALLYAVYICKDIVIGKLILVEGWLKELLSNINSGIKLAFSNLAGMLVIGVIRFFISGSWGIETFGKVSLTLSISSLFMIFINSAAIVLFPFLKQFSEKSLSLHYLKARYLLMAFMPLLLLAYYPVQYVLGWWLPEYKDSLKYMILLMPMIIFEAKTLLLLNTYLKVLRRESLMFYVNLALVLISIVFSLVFVYIFKSLELLLLSLTLLLIFRSTILEIYLVKSLLLPLPKVLFVEVCYSLLFIVFVWFFSIELSFIVTSILLLLIIIPQIKIFSSSFSELKRLS